MPEEKSWLLAIDTATDQSGIALFDGIALVARTWAGGRQQTTRLLPQLESLARDADTDLAAIAAVAVAIGPGSFTGLRVGLSVAKGLSLASGCMLLGIPTLDISAAPYVEAGVSCLAVAPAGRNRVVWADYDPSRIASPTNSTFDELVLAVETREALAVVGELDGSQRARLEAAGARLVPHAAGFRQPGVLAELGRRRWQAGDVDDPVALEPAYLHGRPNPH